MVITVKRTREQARKNWIKAQKRAEKYGVYSVATKTEEYRKMVEYYRNCPNGYDVDHTIALADGGTHTLANLRYLTTHENRSLGGQMSKR